MKLTWLLVLVISLAAVYIHRSPVIVQKYEAVSTGALFWPSESSDFLPGLCRIMLYKHHEMIFSVYDCGPEITTNVTVLLHGFPDNSKTFRKQIEPLVSAGFRALIPTLRGYEPSSQSYEQYHVTQLSYDIMSIINSLEIEDFHIVGHDWGAIIAQTMGIYFPEKIKSIVSVAVPPQLFSTKVGNIPSKQLSNSWYMLFFQTPWIPEISIKYSNSLIKTLYKSWSPTYNWDSDSHLKEVLQTFDLYGVPTAAVGYYRHNVPHIVYESIKRSLSSLPDTLYYDHPLLGKNRVPTLLVTGKDDGCIMTEIYDFPANRALTSYETVRLDGGHFVHYENPGTFNLHMLKFIQKYSGEFETNLK